MTPCIENNRKTHKHVLLSSEKMYTVRSRLFFLGFMCTEYNRDQKKIIIKHSISENIKSSEKKQRTRILININTYTQKKFSSYSYNVMISIQIYSIKCENQKTNIYLNI
ncbi:hypothetical protein CDIK_0321 [Cucumispora dikerogammari]|nr:hypothetical protein CDIK_0321 [Cucumispora dikerogammari]